MATAKALAVLNCTNYCAIHSVCVRPMKDKRLCTDAQLTCCGKPMTIGAPSQHRREADGMLIPTAFCATCQKTVKDLKLYFR